jgi:drug/metabolite transporter (DMT)-like permease
MRTEPKDSVLTEKWKIVLLVMAATLCVAVGEAILAKGMKQTVNVSGPALQQVRAYLNPRVLLGTVLMATYFGMYMYALKLADLSFVLPLTAVSYLLGALLAKYYLHEQVTPTRWIGTLVIVLGVIIVGFGEGSKP